MKKTYFKNSNISSLDEFRLVEYTKANLPRINIITVKFLI